MTTKNEIKPAAPAEALDGGRCAVDAGFGVWQPIETAPRTRQSYLVFCPRNICQYVVYWDEAEEGWRHFGAYEWLYETPSHWTPLPPSPNTPVRNAGEKISNHET